MAQFIFWAGIGFGAGVVFASFFEWTLHRYIMHQPLGKFRYPFEAHALVHHRIFRADESYHLQREKDKWTIPMAWWNGPALVFLCCVPFIGFALVTQRWGALVGAALSFVCYYATYEYLHWCMHLPKKRGLEKSGVFYRLNGHHLLHHRYMNRNFNVVLPLADFILGTLLRRAPVRFRQAMGSSVPNVQPKETPKKEELVAA